MKNAILACLIPLALCSITHAERPKAFEPTIESPFTWRDVRYTTKGEYLYAYVLAWPPKNRPYVELAFLAPGNTRIGEIRSVEMLGHDGELEWEHHPDGLRVTFPKEKPCDFAYGLKIHLTTARKGQNYQ